MTSPVSEPNQGKLLNERLFCTNCQNEDDDVAVIPKIEG